MSGLTPPAKTRENSAPKHSTRQIAACRHSPLGPPRRHRLLPAAHRLSPFAGPTPLTAIVIESLLASCRFFLCSLS